MYSMNDHSKKIKNRNLHLCESTIRPLRIGASKTGTLIAMVARSDARVHLLTEELYKTRELLEEANQALAEAGVPYQPDNIRERISAYQVFRKLMFVYVGR